MTEAVTHKSKRTSERGSFSQPLMGLVWIAFIALMAFQAETLDSIWNWLRSLPLAAEILMWIVALPWALGLLVWESSWDAWLRVLVVLLLALVSTRIFGSRR
jgi:hypothetical protein